jgi:ABC-2 type transport system ATP-binding protein
MIEIFELQKRYGSQVALSVPSLLINQTDFIGLVGNNGAGKTTLLSLILDLIKPSSGYVCSNSEKVSETDNWKNYTASYLHTGFLIPFLSPLEFLEFVGSLHGKNKADVHVFLEDNRKFFDIQAFANKYIRDLSAGNKNKVGILSTLLSEPKVLILDEPFSNLDPSSQIWLKSKLKEIHQSGVLTIVSSHDLSHLTEICNRVILLEEGTIINDSETSQATLSELEKYFKVVS